jgi:hypothetical protein
MHDYDRRRRTAAEGAPQGHETTGASNTAFKWGSFATACDVAGKELHTLAKEADEARREGVSTRTTSRKSSRPSRRPSSKWTTPSSWPTPSRARSRRQEGQVGRELRAEQGPKRPRPKTAPALAIESDGTTYGMPPPKGVLKIGSSPAERVVARFLI